MAYQQLQKLLDSNDFQQNPFKALIKRLWWRWRWTLTNRPYAISFADTLKITIPKTGNGAGIYYRGFSEPDTADFFHRFLRSGMVMFDVGAHIGEYTLLAAKLVGESGQVHAFEPQSLLFPILSANVEMNGLNSVVLNRVAVSDRVGTVEFQVLDEPTMSSIRKPSTIEQSAKIVSVACTSLDTYWSERSRKIDLIKVDVEGAEKFVFQGAEKLLSLPATTAPTWIFEYAPNSYADFNYQPQDLLDLLKQHGYEICQYCKAGQINDFNPNSQLKDIVNLIATKDKSYLLSMLAGTHRATTSM